MKKTIFLAALILAGCATQSTAPAQYYRAVGQVDQLAISGTLKQSIGNIFSKDYQNDITILINGQIVASASFSGGAVEIPGTYAGKPLLADCAAIASGGYTWNGMNPTNVKCVVTIAGERAAALLLAP